MNYSLLRQAFEKTINTFIWQYNAVVKKVDTGTLETGTKSKNF